MKITNKSYTDISKSGVAPGAVCHEIMTRILPMLSHDIVGLLSVAKMQVVLAKRRTDPIDPNNARFLETLNAINQQLIKAISATRELSIWGVQFDAPIDVDEAIHTCIRLSKNTMGKNNFSIELEPTEGQFNNRISTARFHYAVLSVLTYWQDKLQGKWHMKITVLDNPLQLMFRLEEMESEEDSAADELKEFFGLEDFQARPEYFMIDEAALRGLLEVLQWRVEIEALEMRIYLPEHVSL